MKLTILVCIAIIGTILIWCSGKMFYICSGSFFLLFSAFFAILDARKARKGILPFLLLISIAGNSQELKIGDRVPDIKFNRMDGSTFNLYDDSATAGMIVLDFWATWCNPCIKAFPKLDSLQRVQKGMKYILVNSIDTKDDFTLLVKWDEIQKKHKLKYIKDVAITDRTALNYFPHKVIPHYVWMRYEQHGEGGKGKYYVVGMSNTLTAWEGVEWAPNISGR